jgi:hypothetical protein
MAVAKLIVIYPRPTDAESFERAYLSQHVPMAVDNWPVRPRLWRAK